MKASQVLKQAMQFYVSKYEDEEEGHKNVYMCHVLSYNRDTVGWTETAIEDVKYRIQEFLDPWHCMTLHVALVRSDKIYNSYSKRFGFSSKACYSRRVKWFENLITQLESEGL